MSQSHRRALAMLVAAYDPTHWTPTNEAAYLVAIDDLPADVVHLAIINLIRSPLRFMPRPGEIRQAVLRLVQPERPDPGEAWRTVLSEIARVGRYETPDFDPLTRRAVEAIGGWQALCNSTNTIADRARFLDAYERLAQREETAVLVAPALDGIVAELGHRLSLPAPEEGP